MLPNFAVSCGLVTFTEKILNGKLHFLCSGVSVKKKMNSNKTTQQSNYLPSKTTQQLIGNILTVIFIDYEKYL